jgi:DNA-binding MarR family transcriptional regulator
MCIEAIDAVWSRSKAKFEARLVMLLLANYTHPETGSVEASAEFVAAKCRMSARKLRQHIAKLERMGELRVTAGMDDGERLHIELTPGGRP